MVGCLFIILVVLGYITLDFAISAGLIWVICWAFDLFFNWKAVIGVWILLILISSRFNAKVEREK